MEAPRPDVAILAASDHLLNDTGGSCSRCRWNIGHETMVPIGNVDSNGDLSPNCQSRNPPSAGGADAPGGERRRLRGAAVLAVDLNHLEAG